MLTEKERIRILAQTKKERLKAEAIDILIDALHRQTRGGATVSFDHNLALKIEKLIIGNMRRAKIIAVVRTEIHKPRDSSRESGKLGPRMATSVSALWSATKATTLTP
jgi:hypothetical protein